MYDINWEGREVREDCSWAVKDSESHDGTTGRTVALGSVRAEFLLESG